MKNRNFYTYLFLSILLVVAIPYSFIGENSTHKENLLTYRNFRKVSTSTNSLNDLFEVVVSKQTDFNNYVGENLALSRISSVTSKGGKNKISAIFINESYCYAERRESSELKIESFAAGSNVIPKGVDYSGSWISLESSNSENQCWVRKDNLILLLNNIEVEPYDLGKNEFPTITVSVPTATVSVPTTTETLNLYRVVLHPEGHSSKNWAENRTNPSLSYPAVQPYYTKPNGPKASIKWTPEMLKYLENLQIDFKAYKEILWVAGGIFNVQGNKEYLPDQRVPNTRYYIPANGPWPTPPVSQPVTSINNLVNSLEMQFRNGVWWHRIETIPVGFIPNFTHLEKPWLFNNPFTSITTNGNQIGKAIDSRGVIVPLYSKGEAWIPGTVLDKIERE